MQQQNHIPTSSFRIYHSEFGGTKRHVRRPGRDATDAFFQGQQALVDFCALGAQLPVVRQRVLPSLAPGQVHEAQLPEQSPRRPPQSNLKKLVLKNQN